MKHDWNNYDSGKFFDELISSPGHPRKIARQLVKHLKSLDRDGLLAREQAAKLAIKNPKITAIQWVDFVIV